MKFQKGKPPPPGSGRQKGVPNKITAAKLEELAASGVVPLDVMVDNMRFFHRKAQEAEAMLLKMSGGDKVIDAREPRRPAAGDLGELEQELGASPEEELTPQRLLRVLVQWRRDAQNAAKDAAPYYHPKLAQTDIAVQGGIEVAYLDPEDKDV